MGQVVWYSPIISTTLELEVRRSSWETGLGRSTRPYLESKKGWGLAQEVKFFHESAFKPHSAKKIKVNIYYTC
jgi:hypothetical protein